LSFDDCPEIRGHAKECGFQIIPVGVRYTLGGPQKKTEAKELLISNYRLAA